MKKTYKYSILSFIILGIFFGTFKIFAEEEKNSGYDLYLKRNKELCTEYKPAQPLFSAENDYEDLGNFTDEKGNKTGDKSAIDGNDLDIAKQQYKNTMNSTYKCALLSAQERSINFIMKTLKENSEASGYTKEYDAKLNRLQSARKINNCIDANKSTKANDQKNVVDQTTFELCKYNNYLEYLLEYNSVIANVLEQDKKAKANNTLGDNIAQSVSPDQITNTYNITAIANLEKQKKQEISNEIERAYKIYPIAFQAYSEYENNLPVHDLLTMLRNDFIEYRLDLHKSLNPINQVVYKISNAMKE